jgi:hypothetical protein
MNKFTKTESKLLNGSIQRLLSHDFLTSLVRYKRGQNPLAFSDRRNYSVEGIQSGIHTYTQTKHTTKPSVSEDGSYCL